MKLQLLEHLENNGRRAYNIYKDGNIVNGSTVYPDEGYAIQDALWVIMIARRLQAGWSDRMAVIRPGDENK